MAIILKIILALFLGILPFLFAWHTKKTKEKNEGNINIYTFIKKNIPLIQKFYKRISAFIKRVKENMKKSDNARRFYTIIILMVLLVYTYTDYQATSDAAESLLNIAQSQGESSKVYQVALKTYFPMISNVWTLLFCQILTFCFFLTNSLIGY